MNAPTLQQVTAWAREVDFPIESGGVPDRLEDFAAVAFAAGQARERTRCVTLCLSPLGQKLAGLTNGADQLAAAIETGDFQ